MGLWLGLVLWYSRARGYGILGLGQVIWYYRDRASAMIF